MAAQVALDCCEKESAYNPFYAQVLARTVQAGGLPRLALRHCLAERLRRCGTWLQEWGFRVGGFALLAVHAWRYCLQAAQFSAS